tara:strand:+ start:68 stop:715 length:648 start_codon:yes stop_codon:yes gene_type:complete
MRFIAWTGLIISALFTLFCSMALLSGALTGESTIYILPFTIFFGGITFIIARALKKDSIRRSKNPEMSEVAQLKARIRQLENPEMSEVAQLKARIRQLEISDEEAENFDYSEIQNKNINYFVVYIKNTIGVGVVLILVSYIENDFNLDFLTSVQFRLPVLIIAGGGGLLGTWIHWIQNRTDEEKAESKRQTIAVLKWTVLYPFMIGIIWVVATSY